ncbi:MAG: HAD family phosphatase [Myxococcales bacterium]|nr:HAD family phosphatase [Myxococcales bacterium]
MTQLDGMVWDLGGVLLDVDTEVAVRHWTEVTGIGGQRLQDALFGTGRHDRLGIGELSPEELAWELATELAVDFPVALFRAGWERVLTVRTDMAALVNQVAERVSTGVLSDTDPVHASVARRTTFAPAVKHWTVSYEVGAYKPSPAMYRAVCHAMGLPPEKLLFIDDREGNVRGAREYGMRAEVFQSRENLETLLQEVGFLER